MLVVLAGADTGAFGRATGAFCVGTIPALLAKVSLETILLVVTLGSLASVEVALALGFGSVTFGRASAESQAALALLTSPGAGLKLAYFSVKDNLLNSEPALSEAKGFQTGLFPP